MGEQRLSMRWDDQGKRLCMAWPTARVGTDEDYALDVLMTILANGRTSRLQRALVFEGQLATSLSASNDSRVEHGSFWLFAEAARDADPEAVEAVIEEELARLATKAPSAAEMKRARAMLLASEAYDAAVQSVRALLHRRGTPLPSSWRPPHSGWASTFRTCAWSPMSRLSSQRPICSITSAMFVLLETRSCFAARLSPNGVSSA